MEASHNRAPSLFDNYAIAAPASLLSGSEEDRLALRDYFIRVGAGGGGGLTGAPRRGRGPGAVRWIEVSVARALPGRAGAQTAVISKGHHRAQAGSGVSPRAMHRAEEQLKSRRALLGETAAAAEAIDEAAANARRMWRAPSTTIMAAEMRGVMV